MKTVAWIALALMALLGVLGGVTRAIVVTHTLQGAPKAELAPEDRANLQQMSSILAIPPGSERYQLVEHDMTDASLKYNSHPVVVLLHVVPGAAFLFLAPLQLVARVRDRRAAVHRSSGYLLLALAVPFALSGFYLAVVDPFFGPFGAIAAVLAGVLFVNAGVRAYAAIRRGDVTRHRAWMLRFLAIAYGIVIVRLVSLPILMLFPVGPKAAGPPSFWIGWFVSVMLAEWWIRRSPLQYSGPRHVRAA